MIEFFERMLNIGKYNDPAYTPPHLEPVFPSYSEMPMWTLRAT